MSLSDGYTGRSIGKWRTPPFDIMSDPHQTPLQEAISFLTIALSCRCRLLRGNLENVPVSSPALFWVASIAYHWFPSLNAVRTPQMPMLVSAAAIGGAFFVVTVPFTGLLAAWFSSAQMANLERQTAKLQRNRARGQRQRRNRDRYDAR